MKRLLSLFLMLVALSSLAFSQELTVKSFKVSQGDILARTAATCRYDTNDKYCALIKVGIALDDVEFECSGGVRDVVKRQVSIGYIFRRTILNSAFFIRITLLWKLISLIMV